MSVLNGVLPDIFVQMKKHTKNHEKAKRGGTKIELCKYRISNGCE